MQALIHFVGALILTYAISRITRHLPLAREKWRGLALNHLLALAIALAIVAALRLPLQAFGKPQLWQLLLAQGVWALIDMIRHNWPRLR